jgi:dTDP-4-dehydrorhamnose reductase
MRVVILGGSGMLGHKLAQSFSPVFDTHVTFRSAFPDFDRLGVELAGRSTVGVSAQDLDSVRRVLSTVRPDVVVNCIGIVKQDAAAKDPIASITVNSLFPHQVGQACADGGARLIHVSTDCVFSGNKGNYAETDFPDADDLYGRTKLLGEVTAPNALTIRTSIIGRELAGHHGLLEWFLSQEGKRIRGFTRAIFSGFTTNALASILCKIIIDHQALTGLWHVAAEPINKFDLLSLIRSIYGSNIEIDPDNAFVCDRSLDGSRFRTATGLTAPSWPDMIRDMHNDETPYAELQRSHAAR